MNDLKARNKAKLAHIQKYDTLAKKIGLDILRQLIPATPFEIRQALQTDPNLNTIRLHKWDAADHIMRTLFVARAGIKSWSMADTVCTLKHVARFHYHEYQRHTATGKVHIITRGMGPFAVSACGLTNLERMNDGDDKSDLCIKCRQDALVEIAGVAINFEVTQ